jgi:hypothetical protein
MSADRAAPITPNGNERRSLRSGVVVVTRFRVVQQLACHSSNAVVTFLIQQQSTRFLELASPARRALF